MDSKDRNLFCRLQEITPESIGRNISLIREAAGKTQKDVAVALKLSRNTIAKYESGQAKRALKNIGLIKSIAEILSTPTLPVTPEDILGDN